MALLDNISCQNSRASLGNTHHLSVFHPAPHQEDISRYWVSILQAFSTLSPMPYSRFAVRCVHRYCLMLPPDTSLLKCPCLVGVPLPSGKRWVCIFRRMCHARRTYKAPLFATPILPTTFLVVLKCYFIYNYFNI